MSSVQVRYIVHDVDSAIQFYVGLLGFEVDMHPAPGFAVLRRIEGKGGRQVLLEDPSGNLIELFHANQVGPHARERRTAGNEHPRVAPFLAVDDVAEFIAFAQHAFGAEVRHRMASDDGVVRHATVAIDDSVLMVSSGTDRYGQRPATLHLYVDDVDATYGRALGAGAQSIERPSNQFYGDRRAGVSDRWGNHYWVATQIEHVDPKELARREQQFRQAHGD